MPLTFFISLLATCIFGVIDAMFFLFAEDLLQERILKFKFFDEISSELLTGGISASIAIFVSSYIGFQIKKKYQVLESPIYDSLGILLGTFVVLFIYKIFTLKKNKFLEDKKLHVIPKH